ncbi:HET-domain-containing protein [Hyaloscypha variabilis F]|uniref:HET-domain-containing protein n=1 Tax=Hyaloscypha variabilis (strain UAMH 11265 / GT02V1 / F) TaxID=1149755 RepID=A0A2J6RQT3_HYAVF|nr:HET-domain-containing protein [Hyaloscypha variabilis F]
MELRPPLYAPLLASSRQFRLLILGPCIEPGETIICNLITESLDSAPQYEALSYTWGEPVNEAEIVVNSITLPLRKNLWDALYHLRGDIPRTLWIDAVCINQDNIPERNEQVQMMRHIYERAQRAVIWLGVQSDDSQLAFKFMKLISSDRRRRARKSEKLEGTKQYTGTKQELKAVKLLCQRPYWERLWIVQEVVVSQDAELLCGMDHMPWDDFSRFQKCLEDGDIELNGDDSIRKTLAFNLDRYRAYNHIDYSNIIELLEAFSSSLCYEVRDKIYGLIGLARDAAKFPIDYSRSLYDIFVDVMWLQDKEDCALLIACGQFVQWLLKGEVAKSTPKIHPSEERAVGAIGYKISSVEAAFETTKYKALSDEELLVLPSTEDLRHDVERLLQFKEHGHLANRMYVASGNSSYALRGGNTYDKYTRMRIEKPWGKDRNPKKPEPWGQLNRLTTPPNLEYEIPENQGLKYFIDSRGYLGITACDIRKSDTVCQFHASDVVTILRWQEKSSCYLILGSAVFPKRSGEVDTPFFVDAKETFQFSVPTSEECRKSPPISLWLTPYDLQRLTQ